MPAAALVRLLLMMKSAAPFFLAPFFLPAGFFLPVAFLAAAFLAGFFFAVFFFAVFLAMFVFFLNPRGFDPLLSLLLLRTRSRILDAQRVALKCGRVNDEI
jgi:hypothetical protein